MKSQSSQSIIILCGGMSKRMGQDKGSMKIQEVPMIIHVLEAITPQINEVIIVLNDRDRIAKYKSIIDSYLKKLNKKFKFNLIFLEDEIKNKGPLSGIMTGLKNISSEYGLILPCDSPFISNEYIKNMFEILDEIKSLYNNVDGITPFHFKKKLENEDKNEKNNIKTNKKTNKKNNKKVNGKLNRKTKENDNKKDNKNEIDIPKSGFYKEGVMKNFIIENTEPLHSIYKKNTYKTIESLLEQNEMKVKSLIKSINSYFILIDEYKDNSTNKKLNYNISSSNFKNINYKKDINEIN
ncbi:hypothetical protein MARBORIA2_17280 [Methanobrevibacter arboriphilus]|jgi:molybdopterin-guanine dinucleotide biosynthesis protein A|uniref:Uncharacterized protein n=1 Tax=Methanobrevibacter arboriphilus TaxID=39441 RepID=A0ACA8R117_METAZ|nr:molybdenum cofactor guanylyltransferase [Methanobrevibacter arboriphilus]BBL61036.1 hypothetical protein MarbSA_00760 [Methanobrevibacter arboriphilus]GLI12638.1 hypothetical protein MARBORIA2_17280 [Methanobrevibacter arboriphilus]